MSTTVVHWKSIDKCFIYVGKYLSKNNVMVFSVSKWIEEKVKAIRESGLFDDAYYLAMCTDIQPQPQDSYT